MRLVLYTGKGGVGKTTTAAATALAAATRGRRTLIVSADAAHSLGDVLGQRLSPDPTPIRLPSGSGEESEAAEPAASGGLLEAAELDARVAMRRHWGRVRDFLVRLFVHQGIDPVVADELALLPGAEEITTLLALEEHAASGRYDFAIVDCAPTDSALRLLSLPDIAEGSLRLVLPALRTFAALAAPVAQRLVELPLPDSAVFQEADRLLRGSLGDLRARITARDTTVRLVTTTERMVIDESRRTQTELGLFDIACDAVVVNRMLPDVAAEEAFFRDWLRVQGERVAELREVFAPLPLLEAPLQDDEVRGPSALARHGAAIFRRCEPDAILCRSQPARFRRRGRDAVMELPLPGADPSGLDVVKIDDELAVTAGSRRRRVKLPRRVAALELRRARLDGGRLIVDFGAEAAEPAPAPGPP